MDDDARLIKDLGGPAKVAELLGFSKEGGVQRVQNWLARGIPAAIKVKHPELFMRANDSDYGALDDGARPVGMQFGDRRGLADQLDTKINEGAADLMVPMPAERRSQQES